MRDKEKLLQKVANSPAKPEEVLKEVVGMVIDENEDNRAPDRNSMFAECLKHG